MCTIDFENWDLRFQGAESRLYFGIHQDNRCVIKHRFSKKYRHPILDKKLTKERTKRERRFIEKIKANSKILSAYMPKVAWSNESTILMSEIQNCRTVYNFIEQQPANVGPIAPLIGKCVAELHSLGIIHGDLTTSNLLIVPEVNNQDKTMVIPIDFGLSTGSDHPEEMAVDLYVLERALLTAHFSDSDFFNAILEAYYAHGPLDKQKISERLRDVRARGRKAEYTDD